MSTKSYRILLFILLYITYGSTYLVRKPLGVIKSDMAKDMELSKFQLGLLDTSLLLPYALMQVLLGPLADKLGIRKTLVLCLLLSGTSMALYGVWDSFYFCLILLFLNGTALAPCWPACSKGIALWFQDFNSRDTIFGILGSSGLVGGVSGTALAVWFQANYGWRLVHLIPSLFIIFLSLIVAIFVLSPREKGLSSGLSTEIKRCSIPNESPALIDKDNNELANVKPNNRPVERLRSWLSLFYIPCIPEITATVFSLKFVRYCMYLWLPLFLTDYLHYDKSQGGMMSTAFDIGGGIGSTAIGFAIQRFCRGRTMSTLCVSVILSASSLLLFIFTAHWGPTANIIWLLLAGATNCGPDSLLSGSIPAQLGEKNGLGAGAALTGIVNGAGSLGTPIQPQ